MDGQRWMLRFWKNKKIEVKCPDGTTRYVYNSVDVAFPMYLSDVKNDIKARANLNGIAEGDIQNVFSRDIRAILVHIDECNQSLMLEFRSAYIGFEADPCGNSKWFQDSLTEIRRHSQQISRLKLKLNTLLECLKHGEAGTSRVDQILRDISIDHPTLTLPRVVAAEMQEATRIANELSGGAI